MKLLTILLSVCIFIAGTTNLSYGQESGAVTTEVLWGIAGNGSGDVIDANTTLTVAEGVSGPDGSDLNDGVNGLGSFVVGGPYTAGDHFKAKLTSSKTSVDIGSGYIEFTVTADSGYALNLSSLDFDSARGGDSGTRGFEIYGKVQGAPAITDLLLDIDNESGTRSTPANRSIDLSAAHYDEVYSITFRYYPLATNGSIEFNNLKLIGSVFPSSTSVETGYDLWMRYSAISNTTLLNQYRQDASLIVVEGSSDTLTAITTELNTGLDGLLGQNVPVSASVTQNGAVIVGTPTSSQIVADLAWGAALDAVGEEGYLIRSAMVNGKAVTVVASNGEVGALYGTFNFLRLIQTNQSLSNLDISETPKIKHRMLNHWDWDKDNHQHLVERGYAGNSIWKWDELPGIIDPRYTDYARANASIGINGVVLNNVNAQPLILTAEYLAKVKVLADIFRPYGIKVYLTARYDAPMHADSDVTISSANSTLPEVQTWWGNKVNEIYDTYIPDFGGFLMKVDSEGQPGPETTYNIDHASGANPIAEKLDARGGLLIWRTFVHDKSLDADRVKRPYIQFTPLDGQFRSNVILQCKNGPFDFQPREPIHPLFGGMPNTAMGMEFQITQEYLGHSTHLVYNAPMWKEVLDFDTYASGADSTVAKVIDGSLNAHSQSMIAGVANIGSDTNWCGHHFAQANWYAYGRLAWNHELTSEGIADEWIRMTWSNDVDVRTDLTAMMLPSWEAAVNYMTPLGLAFTVSGSDFTPSHYYPQPSKRDGKYWFSDSSGLGYDRTTSGTGAVGQYATEVETTFNSLSDCPEKYLLWFHKVPWTHTMNSGRTMWDELCYKFNHGIQHVIDMQTTWNSLSEKIDFRRFGEVQSKLSIHRTDATDFKDTYIAYFQGKNGLVIPPYSTSNQAPTFTVNPINAADATKDVTYSGSVANATDADGDTLNYSKINGPAWLTVGTDGSLSGTPAQADTGPNVFTVLVDDGNDSTDTATLNINVISGSTTALIANFDFETYAVGDQPGGNNGGTQDRNYNDGSFTTPAGVTVSDITFTVADANTNQNKILTDDSSAISASGTAPDGSTSDKTYRADFDTSAPVTVSFDVTLAAGYTLSNSVVSFGHESNRRGTYKITVDGAEIDAATALTAVDSWTQPQSSSTIAGPLSGTFTVSIELNNTESNGTIYLDDFQLNGTLSTENPDSTTYTVTFKMGDGSEVLVSNIASGSDITSQIPEPVEVAGKTFTGWDKPVTNITASIIVNALYSTDPVTNNAPIFTVNPINEADATEDIAYSGSVANATDADGDTLGYSKINGPAWLTVGTDGSVSGTPTQSDAGANVFTVKVDDGNGGTDTATLNITVISSSTTALIANFDFETYAVGDQPGGTNGGTQDRIYNDGNFITPAGVTVSDITFTVADANTNQNKILEDNSSIISASGTIPAGDSADKTYRADFDTSAPVTVSFDVTLAAGYTLSNSVVSFGHESNRTGTYKITVDGVLITDTTTLTAVNSWTQPESSNTIAGPLSGTFTVSIELNNTQKNGTIYLDDFQLNGTLSPEDPDSDTTYTVTFKMADGSEVIVSDIESGSDITSQIPEPVEVVGKTFTGWDKPVTNITASIAVNALYSDNSYDVTFQSGEGTQTDVVSTVHDQDAVAPTPATVEGKIFTGWQGDYSNVTAKVTITAIYSSDPGLENDAYIQADGLAVMEAENAHRRFAGSTGDEWLDANDISGFAANGFVVAGPNNGTNHKDTTNGAYLEFDVNFTSTGTHYIWVRMYGANGKDDSLHAGLDSPTTFGGAGFTNKSATWTWVGQAAATRATVEIPSSGVHTVRIWQREDGTRLDRVLITNDSSYTPSAQGPPESQISAPSTVEVSSSEALTSSADSPQSTSIITGAESAFDDLHNALLDLAGTDFILLVKTESVDYLFGSTFSNDFNYNIIDDQTYSINYTQVSEIEDLIRSLFDESEIIDIRLLD
jgi:alpha-glucuronidase